MMETPTTLTTRKLLTIAVLVLMVLFFAGRGNASRLYAAESAKYEVDFSYLNVRSGPGTDYDKLGTLNDGDRITIEKTQDGWGSFTYNGKTAWVKMSYLKKVSSGSSSSSSSGSSSSSSSSSSTSKASTTSEYNYVVNHSFVNVRSGPGTDYDKVGKLNEGDKIYILQVRNNWGRFKYNGTMCYVCMDYMKKPQEIKDKEAAEKAAAEKAAGASSSSSSSKSGSSSGTSSGTVYTVTYKFLNVRAENSSSSKKLGSLNQGDKITVTEVKDDWGKITYQGQTAWVSLAYAKKADSTASSGSSAAAGSTASSSGSGSSSSDTKTVTPKTTGTYKITADFMSVRKGPDASYSEMGKVYQGSVVKVTEIQSIRWGKISYNGKDGWINVGYCTKVSSDTAVNVKTTADTSANTRKTIETSAHKSGWYQTDGKWVYYNSKGNAAFTNDAMHSAWTKIKNKTSSTSMYIVVDTSVSQVFIFTGSAGKWIPDRVFSCSAGKSSTPTKKGLFSIQTKGYSFGGSNYTCYYYSQFSGGYLFHSVLYKKNSHTLLDGRLGANYSHGCVRLSLDHAKWIYDNAPAGTKVYVY